MFDKALVPFDGSTQVDRVLSYVARLAGGLNMPLVLAAVLAPGSRPTLEQMRQEVDRHLQEIVTQLAGAGAEATAVVAVGRPVQEIVRLAEQEKCNLILLPPRREAAHGWGKAPAFKHEERRKVALPGQQVHTALMRRRWCPSPYVARWLALCNAA